MKKHLANICTSSRIVGAFILFLFNEFTPAYLCLYVFCGFTDFIDGPIARKTGSASPLGAALDTIGDVLTYFSLVKILVVNKMLPGWLFIWLMVNVVFGFAAAFFALKKFKKFYLPHTYLGKSLGGIIFLLPLAIQVVEPNIWFCVICGSMSLALLEIFYIQIRSKKPMDFVATIFHINKEAAKEDTSVA